MVRKTLITALAVGALVATPLVAYAQNAGTTAGSPIAASVVLDRFAATDPPGGSTGPTTSTSPPAGSGGTGTSGGAAAKAAGQHDKHGKLRWLRDHRLRLAGVLHAQWTTKTKDGSFVTHDSIHGTVGTLASGSTSITVTAVDHTSQTYSTSSSTKVWKVTQDNGKRRVVQATLTDVTKGADVVVEGTGAASPYIATRILVQLDE